MKKQRMRRDLGDEIAAHIAERADDLIEGGMPAARAREQARREFGNPTLVAETGGETWGWLWLERLGRDLRYAARALRASPLFTVTAILSLALGIGANTAIFTLLYASLWRPLPVPGPHQVYQLRRHADDGPWTRDSGSSYVLFQEFGAAAGSMGEVFAKGRSGAQKFAAEGVSQERISGEAVSANFFSALEVRPFLGRVFESPDDSPLGGRRVAVLSYAFWTHRFRSDPAVLGKTILYGESPYTVVGIAPPRFTGIDAEASVDVWVPVTTTVKNEWLGSPNINWLQCLVRLRPGTSPARAQALFENVFRVHVTEKLLPDTPPHWKPMLEAQRIDLRSAAAGLSTTGHKYEKQLLLLMGVVALVLLISCGNVANLMLARNSARQHEISIRLALGAGPGRIVRQLFAESLLLAVAGAVAGLAIASWGAQVLVSFLPRPEVPLAFDLRPGLPVLAFTAAISIATALLFGLLPAWRAGRAGAGIGLRHSRRITHASFSGRVLVAGQLALSLILLVAAGLFAVTLRNLNATDLGFRPDHLVAFDISMPKATPAGRVRQVYGGIRERLESQTGAVASYAWPSVYSHGGWEGGIEVEGHPSAPNEDNDAGMISAGPDLFEALGMRLLQGRYLNAQDQAGKPPVVVVNETFARHYFGAGTAIGGRIRARGQEAGFHEIVGVVRDARHFGVREKIWRMVYFPRWNAEGGTFFVRSQADLRGSIRRVVAVVDKTAQVDGIRAVAEDVDDMISEERLTATLCSILGALAVLLAAIGLYGVVAYGVSRRTGEFGIRMALGAQRGDVQRLVLRQTAFLVLAGVAAGLAAAVVLVRMLSASIAGMLYGVSPGDGFIFAGAALLLAAIALLAAFLPARRASRIEPTVAVRYE